MRKFLCATFRDDTDVGCLLGLAWSRSPGGEAGTTNPEASKSAEHGVPAVASVGCLPTLSADMFLPEVGRHLMLKSATAHLAGTDESPPGEDYAPSCVEGCGMRWT